MVERTDISRVFENILSDFDMKCTPSIGEMKESLKDLSYTDQYNQLKEKDYLNPLEDKDYQDLIHKHELISNHLQTLIDSNDKEDIIQGTRETLDNIEDELFQYGRRLIEGYETRLPIDLDDYRDKAGQRDEQYSLETDKNGKDVFNTMGYKEKEQIELQQKSVKVDPNNVDRIYDDNGHLIAEFMKDKKLLSMDNYFSGDTNHINYEIKHKKYLNKLDSEVRKHIDNIDKLMDESPGLKYNTLLFRGGAFDIHTRIGDTISFKGYQSTSFQSSVAKWYNEDKPDGMLYLIHAPKGTKGIVGNDERFSNGYMEHEYVLPRNTKMKVINIDYENNICEVVIEN